MIDGHKPDDNVDLAESRDVNCVSKIDDNAGGHYNGDTTTVHVVMVMSKILVMVMSKILVMLIKAMIISSTLVMMETAVIMMLMSVMTKMMVTTIAT